jgi:linoleoyl-CoA desaturase
MPFRSETLILILFNRSNMPKVTFNNQKKLFFNSLNERVENYFKERNLKKTGNKKLYIKTSILISAAFATYLVLIIVHLNPAIAIVLCCLFGFLQATVGFNVMHDANHGSFSERKWINGMMGFTANMMGINTWLWKQKHNIIHHTYTNIDGVDIDLAKAPFLRMCPSQKQMKLHRYQYIYCIPLYALTSLMMIFISEFLNYFRKKIQITKLQKMETREHYIFWISKALYIFFYIVLPIWLVGLVPAIIGFTIMHITLGIVLAIVFQLAHVVEATHFVNAQQNAFQIEDEWAVHQVQTTADFATNNKIISWFTGGLNFQVEHHLFPKICHIHYPAIHKFVKEDCEKFSIRLNDYPSMTAALISHLRFLKQLGAQ